MPLTAVRIVALLVALASATSAQAQLAVDAEEKAREMFALGRYGDALDIYGKLYAQTAHPTYIRNVGRCYQNLGEADKAISSFREYLRQVPQISPKERAQVEGYIREMEELKRKREGMPASATGARTRAPVTS